MSTANPYTELTQQTREDLVLEHAPQIKRIVTRMAARFPPGVDQEELYQACLLYTSPSPRDGRISRMPSSA